MRLRQFVCFMGGFLGIALGGCQRPAAPPPAHSVRLEALWERHPLWAQMASLDRLAARFETPPFPLLGVDSAPSFPAPFAVPSLSAADLVSLRETHVTRSDDRTLNRLRSYLETGAKERVTRETKLKKKELDAAYITALAKREATLRDESGRQRSQYEQRIERLGYLLVAYESQVRNYFPPARAQAQRDADRVREEMATLTERREQTPTNHAERARADLTEFRAQQMQTLTTFRLDLEQQLESEIKTQMTQRGTQLQYESQAIPRFGENMPIVKTGADFPLPAAPDAKATAHLASEQRGGWNAQQRTAWRERRQRLLATIQADTEQAVRQIAAQRGWKLSPNAPDATDEVAEALRAQWRTN